MAKKKSNVDTFVRSLVAVIAGAALLAGVLFIAWYFSGGGWFGGAIPSTFTVTMDEQEYSKSFTVNHLYSGTEFKIKTMFGEDYTVAITTAQGTGVTVTDGETQTKWEKLEGDFNKGFDIAKKDDGFIVRYESFDDILEQATELTDLELEGDTSVQLFVMTISCANSEINVSFGVGMNVSGIEFDKDHIIFGVDQNKENTEQGADHE